MGERVSSKVIRGPHRSTMFQILIDVSYIMDENHQAIMEGEDLEEYLIEMCRSTIRRTLAEARKKVKGHP